MPTVLTPDAEIRADDFDNRPAPEELFDRLRRSQFRSRFRLRGKELDYLRRKGLAVVLEHAADFVEKRLAPAEPANDGRQTPMGNHPVFVAQHATATCCRSCLAKWHGIPKGRALDGAEKHYVLEVIKAWLARESGSRGVRTRGTSTAERLL